MEGIWNAIRTRGLCGPRSDDLGNRLVALVTCRIRYRFSERAKRSSRSNPFSMFAMLVA
jgi:hypothetical protein